MNTTLEADSPVPFQNHTVPFCETAAQNVLVTQETPLIAAVCDGVVIGEDHVAPLKVTKSPPALTARQYVGEVQDTASSGGVVGTAPVEVQEVPSKMAAVPSRLTAIQNVDAVHDTPVGLLRPVMPGADQPPALRTNAVPSLLTVTQLVGDPHEIEVRAPAGTSTLPSGVQLEGLGPVQV